MKQTLLVVLLLICLNQLCNAQAIDAGRYRPVVIYYDGEYKVTKAEFAAYKRLAYLPDSLKSIKSITAPKLEGPVRDYYADGNIWALGSYQNGAPVGEWNFYYPNGELDCRGFFDGIWATGKWEFWWPNGQPLMIAEFNKSDMRLLSFWNEKGEQTIVEGNGIYTAITTNEKGRQMKLEGSYSNGYQAGQWTYGPIDGKALVEQIFGTNGMLLTGISYEGNRKSNYNFPNRFKVQPEPKHLVTMGFWTPAPGVYAQGYPIVADLLGCEVEKMPYKSRNKNVKDHYYRIIQKFGSGTDTLDYGIPMEPAYLKGGIQHYLSRNLRFPTNIDQNLEGLIVVQFKINADGKVEEPKIQKSLNASLDEEVLRVVSRMPRWNPATVKDLPVSTIYTLPIRVKRSRLFYSQEDETGFPKGPTPSFPPYPRF